MLRAFTLALGLSAAPLLADTVSVNTNTGPVELATNPDKIAVFDIAALDTLSALGVQADGVINKLFVDYLETGDAVTVGTIHEPDFEIVAALAPDLIIAGGRSAKQVPALNEIAPTVDMTIGRDVFSDGLKRLGAYGEIFGKQEEAAALATALREKLALVQAGAENAGKALVIMTNGPKISAYGSEGRFGWLHNTVGLEKAVEAVEKTTHGEAISFEFISNANPDVLIVIDRLAAISRPGENAAVTLDNELVHGTNAWKNGNVIYLPSAEFYIAGGGVKALDRTLDVLLAAFSGS